ncbi:hypothetical protein chiPu_0028194, partial [Chiloscyllium punctatum]|nr:hypothetical protein [Chiloscyllium punctatum]
DDGDARDHHQHVPADIDRGAAVERDREILAARAEAAEDPAHDHPAQEALQQQREQRHDVAVGGSGIGQKAEHDEDVPDVERLAGEGEVRPARHADIGNRKAVQAGRGPRRGDDEDLADEHQQAAPEQAPDREVGRQRAAAIACRRRHRRRSAGLRKRRRRPCARNKTRNLPRLLPAGHALGPHQRIGTHHATGDQVAELGFRQGALLLAFGCIKPVSVRHFLFLGARAQVGAR